MARQPKFRPIPTYNHHGVEYPLSENFMSMLASVVRDRMTDEITNADMVMLYTPEQMAEIFINPHDMDYCKRAVPFLSSVQWTSGFMSEIAMPEGPHPNTLTFRARYHGHRPPIALPSYVRNGPQNNVVGEVFRLRLREVMLFHRFVATNWINLYAYVSTLNHRCTSLGDVLANFPALEILCRGNNTLMSEVRSAKPARVVTKFTEFRDVYRDAMRTAHRPMLTQRVVRDVSGMWEVTADIDTELPEWHHSSPGFRIP